MPLQKRLFLGDPRHASSAHASSGDVEVTWPSAGKRRKDAVIEHLTDSRGIRTLTIVGEKRPAANSASFAVRQRSSVEDVDKIAAWLKVAPPCLTQLTIDHLACQDAAILALAEALAVNTNLTSLRLAYEYSHRQKKHQDSDAGRSKQAALLLCQVLSSNTSLTDLPSWCVETAGTASHAQARIYLGRNRGLLLCSSLRSMPTADLRKLKKLKLRDYMLGDEGIAVLTSFLTGLTSLAVLDVRENGLTGKGISEVCSGLVALPVCRIRSLFLTGGRLEMGDDSDDDDDARVSHTKGGLWSEDSAPSWSRSGGLSNVICAASVPSLASMLQVRWGQFGTILLAHAASPRELAWDGARGWLARNMRPRDVEGVGLGV
jgi:hypothetical protein